VRQVTDLEHSAMVVDSGGCSGRAGPGT